MIIELLLWQTFLATRAKKMPRTLWVIAASFGNLFALSSFSFYFKLRAIRPWPLPTMGSGT
jgi:hypothetical protein